MSEASDLGWLVGTWTMMARHAEDPNRRTVEFRGDGSMTYRIEVDGRTIVLELSYAVDADAIVTRDPNSGGEVRAHFRLMDRAHLEMDLGGELFEYVRLLG